MEFMSFTGSLNVHNRLMHRQASPQLLKYLKGSAAALLSTSAVHGIDLIENFDGTEVDTAVWDIGGAKTLSVSDGRITMEDGAGNWANGNIRSQQRFFLPEAGETTSIEWVLGAAVDSAESANGETVRMQIGVVSANQTGDNPEHFPNDTGGVWVDLDGFFNTDLTAVSGALFVTNDTKVSGGNGTNFGTVFPSWDWKTGTVTYRLDITDTGYTWFENDAQVSAVNWADFDLDTEFDNGFLSLIHI